MAGFGLKLLWKPLGPVALRVTADENVSTEPTVSVEVPELPTGTVIGVTGLMVKSGTITVNEALELLLPGVKSSVEACTLAVLVTTVPRVKPEFRIPDKVTVAVVFAAMLENVPPCELHDPPVLAVQEL